MLQNGNKIICGKNGLFSIVKDYVGIPQCVFFEQGCLVENHSVERPNASLTI